MIRIRRGLDIVIGGTPVQEIEAASPVSQVALLGDDYVGLRPRMAVAEGDRVRQGQVLFTDRGNPGLLFPSPGCGEVVAIHRGAKRRLQSVVVRLDGDEKEAFAALDGADIDALNRVAVREQLVASGLWTALRARPFGCIPPPDSVPHSIFVTAIDTNPLAPDPAVVLDGRGVDFAAGLQLLGRLTDGPVRLCCRASSALLAIDLERVETHSFEGPHPAGLSGTHIHMLDPASANNTVWYVGYQDVAAVGALFRTGRTPTERVVALAGPMVERPCLVRTRLGASTDELIAGRVRPGAQTVVSGSVLAGRTAAGPVSFLGRYHVQVGVLPAERTWRAERRPILPLRVYERVMPLDVLPTPLLKALAVRDIERAIELGCMELEEEDLALCSYVCPGRSDFGADLRAVLTEIERGR